MNKAERRYYKNISYIAMIDILERILEKAQESRSTRSVEEWVEYERTTMWNAVNARRAELGKSDIQLSELMRIECLAVGHSDYTHKFALYCADLVYKE